MSITDELREWMDRTTIRFDDRGCLLGTDEELTAIADRIDAEHEKAVRERRRSCVYYDPERHYCSCHDYDVSGYVELPKDSDGEYIHVGDRMEWVRYKDGDPTIVRIVSGIGNGVFFAWSDEQGRYAQYKADAYRHHHAPTVEDVLRDVVTLCHNTWKEGSAFEFYDVDDVMKSSNISEYAAKLRLAEGEDA